VRLEIERTQKCALHSFIENLGDFHASNKTYQSDRGFACVDGIELVIDPSAINFDMTFAKF
jgi:hypothetical protein